MRRTTRNDATIMSFEWLPHPTHPALVHIPLGLAFVLPIVIAFLLECMRRGWMPQRTWLIVVTLEALLVGSILIAKEFGEEDEGTALAVVPQEAMELHEERADLLSALAAVAAGAAALGLFSGRLGAWARLITLALSLAVLASAILVGKSGGDLVYRHGAASMYRGG